MALALHLAGLGMENIGGIFVVLICGLIIAVFVAVMEFIWSTRRSAESEEVRRPVWGRAGTSGPHLVGVEERSWAWTDREVKGVLGDGTEGP